MPEMLITQFQHPSAWTREEMQDNPEWSYRLSRDEVAEVKAAVRHALGRQRSLIELAAADFPLPGFGPRFDALRRELEEGRGFELWRGLDVPEWTTEERSVAFWGLGLHLGIPIVQNSKGELLGHVMNTTSTDPSTNANSRFYHTNSAAPFHVDGADVVGLMCVRGAKEGGASLVVSSCSVYNGILRERPDLIPLLYEPLWFDHRGERNAVTGEPYWVTSICGWREGKLSMMYLRNFIESGQRYPGAPQLTDSHRALFDLIDRLAASDEFCLSMDFQPGDIQWFNNHTTLHSRTSFIDHNAADRRRWLLRLWLNLAERNRFTETYGFYGIAAEPLVQQ